jgi:hypothetical protein
METEVMHASENEKQCHERPVRGHTAKLIAQLGSHDGMERQHAREELVRLGEPIVGLLIAALSADRVVFRWEAAKALTDLHAPAAAATLVNTLADEDSDVRWLAAEALAGLGEPAPATALRGADDALGLGRTARGRAPRAACAQPG